MIKLCLQPAVQINELRTDLKMSKSRYVEGSLCGGFNMSKSQYVKVTICRSHNMSMSQYVEGGKSVLLDQEKEFLGLVKDDGKKGKSRLVMGEISGFENFGKM